MDKHLKIAFFGTPRLAQIVLLNLLDSDFKPSLIVTAPDAPAGRGRQEQQSAVKKTAIEKNIEVETPVNFKDFSSKFDLAILIAYGKIIPQEVLDIPKYGFINIHPSLLPKYRGPSPIQTAILNGENETGVTIIKLDAEIDHGPMLAKKSLPLNPTDNHLTLIEKLGTIGSNLLIETLPDYLTNKIELLEQEHGNATLTKHISKTDGFIDLANPPNAEKLDRMIRAYYPWPGVSADLETSTQRPGTRKIRVKFLPPTILPTTINQPPKTFLIQPEGKNPMTIPDFLNGNPLYAPLLAPLLTQ